MSESWGDAVAEPAASGLIELSRRISARRAGRRAPLADSALPHGLSAPPRGLVVLDSLDGLHVDLGWRVGLGQHLLVAAYLVMAGLLALLLGRWGLPLTGLAMVGALLVVLRGLRSPRALRITPSALVVQGLRSSQLYLAWGSVGYCEPAMLGGIRLRRRGRSFLLGHGLEGAQQQWLLDVIGDCLARGGDKAVEVPEELGGLVAAARV